MSEIFIFALATLAAGVAAVAVHQTMKTLRVALVLLARASDFDEWLDDDDDDDFDTDVPDPPVGDKPAQFVVPPGFQVGPTPPPLPNGSPSCCGGGLPTKVMVWIPHAIKSVFGIQPSQN